MHWQSSENNNNGLSGLILTTLGLTLANVPYLYTDTVCTSISQSETFRNTGHRSHRKLTKPSTKSDIEYLDKELESFQFIPNTLNYCIGELTPESDAEYPGS